MPYNYRCRQRRDSILLLTDTLAEAEEIGAYWVRHGYTVSPPRRRADGLFVAEAWREPREEEISYGTAS